jgi:seryl-tRNA synthetase
MLDIIQFIEEKGGNPEEIRRSQKARGDSVEIVDEIVNEYKAWTKSKYCV